MWSQDSTSFEGKHYRVQDVAKAAPLPQGSQPKILIGGGGPRLLGVAGRHADIVGINPTMHEGRITPQSAADLAPERVREKVGWVRESAERWQRDPDAIEFNTLVFVVALADDVSGLRQALSKGTGMSVEEVAGAAIFLTGPPSEVQDKLAKQREETGISYIVIQGDDFERVEQFAAEVVKPLS